MEKNKIYTEKEPLLGYKGLKIQPDGSLKCRDMVYNVGTVYCQTNDPKTCSHGFHFCEKLENVFAHYDYLNKNNVFYKVKGFGKIDITNDKCSAQSIQILEKVTDEELFLAKINTTLEKVDKIIAANPNAVICGSLALILRGWIPFRTIGDIDIVLPNFQEFEGDFNVDSQFGKSGIDTKQCTVNGISFDLFVDPNETWSRIEVNGKSYKVSHIKNLVEAKMRYYMNGAHKHSEDLKTIFDVIKEKYENDKNAFLKNGPYREFNNDSHPYEIDIKDVEF